MKERCREDSQDKITRERERKRERIQKENKKRERKSTRQIYVATKRMHQNVEERKDASDGGTFGIGEEMRAM